MIKIAICDNIQGECENYKEIFHTLAMKNDIDVDFAVYNHGEAILFNYENTRNIGDIVYIKVNMQGMSGLETAKKLRDAGYVGEIIFISETKDADNILLGYDVDALNYIIESETDFPKIEAIFLQAEKVVAQKEKKYILFVRGNEWRNIPIDSIRYFETFKRIVTVHYEKDSAFDFYADSLKQVEKQLDDAGFIRIHRSILVAIREIKFLSYNALTLRNDKKLPVGRVYYARVKEALANHKNIHVII